MMTALTRRGLKKWKVFFFSSMSLVIIWLLCTSSSSNLPSGNVIDKKSSTPFAASLQSSSKSSNAHVLFSPMQLFRKKPESPAKDLQNLIHPLRRSPMPSVDALAEAMPDEENAAEEVDFVKEPQKVENDDNAAMEEHSGQFHGNNPDADNDITSKRLKSSKNEAKLRKGNDLLQIDRLASNDNTNRKIQKPEVLDLESFHQLPEHQKELPEDKYGLYNNWRNLSMHSIKNLSVLGRRLYLNEVVGHEQNRKFKIHFWKYFKYVKNRLLTRFTGKNIDPFEGCSVTNCELTAENDEDVLDADAVVFHMHRITGPPVGVPRNSDQLWIWMSDESPHNVFMVAKDKQLSHYNGCFNWSMTYRMNSDIPVPYGRTVPLPKDQYLETLEDFYKKNPKNIALVGSNCGGRNHRYDYLKELQHFVQVDVYGKCGTLKCPGHFNKDCALLNDYKFYLAFENSNCDDYITEKAWWNALEKGSVPIVMGPTRDNYAQQLPPNSFIHVDDYTSPEHLSQHIKYLLQNPDEYNKFHEWRKKYKVLNEHGYFKTPVYHICRVCEALNYNDRETGPHRASADLEKFFDSNIHCHPAKWRPV